MVTEEKQAIKIPYVTYALFCVEIHMDDAYKHTQKPGENFKNC